jgi:hypothetical protein
MDRIWSVLRWPIRFVLNEVLLGNHLDVRVFGVDSYGSTKCNCY